MNFRYYYEICEWLRRPEVTAKEAHDEIQAFMEKRRNVVFASSHKRIEFTGIVMANEIKLYEFYRKTHRFAIPCTEEEKETVRGLKGLMNL